MQRFEVFAGDLIMSCSGTMGKVAIAPTNVTKGIINQALLKLTPKPVLRSQYLRYWMESGAFQLALTKTAGGAAIQNIASVKVLKEIEVPVPSLKEQDSIIDKITILTDQYLRIKALYATKIAALNELKQSLLHKAFTGQLTSSSAVPAAHKLESPMTANAKLTAQVIVLAHYRHTTARRDKTFGHVKAQKILHLAESCANIPLARSPIKDAAGPNDFAHMLRAEEWAESNGFFKFNQRATGYSFQKLKGYNQLLSEAQERLKPFKQRLDKILGLLVSMDTQEAEVFATVHAAWNNLVVDRKPITDDAIIKEARDNWHQDKLKIPKVKFLKAILLIRKEGLIPDGSAKYVPSHPQGKML